MPTVSCTVRSGVVTLIPSVGVTQADGAEMLTRFGQTASIAFTAKNYDVFNGTSMAAPHVSEVAVLVWSHFPNCTASEIRSTLTKSALDIGEARRDDKTGYGLVQAAAAYNRIASGVALRVGAIVAPGRSVVGSVRVRSRCADALAFLELTAPLGRARPPRFGIGSVGRGGSVGPSKIRSVSSACSHRAGLSELLKIRVSLVRFRPWPPLPTR